MNTPIYDALRQESTSAPLCQICGRPQLHRIEDQHMLVCVRCFEMNRAGNMHIWHCMVCGRYVEGFDRVSTTHINDKTGIVTYTVVCVDDYKESA